MLITFIVTVAVLAGLYLLINICHKKSDRSIYDFSTEGAKSMLIFAHTGFGISFFILAAEILFYFSWKNQTGLWITFGIFLCFAVLLLALLYELYFTYVAIRGDEVYFRGFYKKKKIEVGDIKSIKNVGASKIFYGKENKSLFHIESNTRGIDKLISLINERKPDGLIEDSIENISAEARAIVEKLGQEYRASYNKRKKQFLIGFLAGGTALVLGFVLLMFFIGAGVFLTVFIGVMGAAGVALNLFVALARLKKELSQDDKTLGDRYKFTNKRVKGASKHNLSALRVICIAFMILGALLSFIIWAISGGGESYDDYTPMTGRIEYCREQPGKSNYIAIGLYDVPTEYRLFSIYLDEFDYSFFDEVKVGDTVTILVSNSKDREFSISGVSRKQWNSFYYLATDSKEYFTYEDYVKSHENNDRIGYIIAGVGITIFVVAAGALIIGHFVLKKREKGEDIVIYKS